MPNFDNGVLDITLEAGEDLSSDQYRFVILSSGKVYRPNATTDRPIGILQNDPESGQAAHVRMMGISRVVLGETVAENEYVKHEYISASDAGKGLDADGQYDVAQAYCISGGGEDDLATVALLPFPVFPSLTAVT